MSGRVTWLEPSSPHSASTSKKCCGEQDYDLHSDGSQCGPHHNKEPRALVLICPDSPFSQVKSETLIPGTLALGGVRGQAVSIKHPFETLGLTLNLEPASQTILGLVHTQRAGLRLWCLTMKKTNDPERILQGMNQTGVWYV
jgi:hypothetical protein